MIKRGVKSIYMAYFVPSHNKKEKITKMKKYLWNYSILIGIIIFLAVGIPRITSNEVESFHSPDEKKKVEQLQESFRKWSLKPLDKLMVQSYEAKPNGHEWDSVTKKPIKNYRVTYYTFFGIRYMEVEVS